VGQADSGSGPSFLQGNRPTTVIVFFLFLFISLLFKF
jgi:hypothetical protein